jgi:hypothetical protein
MTDITRTIFCANDQIDQIHVLTPASNGEIQATCTVCGRILKFPADVTPEEFTSMVEIHKAANEGQVTQESIDATLEALAMPIKDLADPVEISDAQEAIVVETPVIDSVNEAVPEGQAVTE